MDHLNKLTHKKLVIYLLNLHLKTDILCDVCKKGKLVKKMFKSKNIISTNWSLQLLHMDHFGLSITMHFGGNYYDLLILDDYSHYT